MLNDLFKLFNGPAGTMIKLGTSEFRAAPERYHALAEKSRFER